MNFLDYLSRQYRNETDVETGAFTISPSKGAETIRESLRFQPYDFGLHLIRAAHFAKVPLEVRTSGPFLTKYFWSSPTIEFRLPGFTLASDQLKGLEIALVGGEAVAVTEIARAFFQARYVSGASVTLESWEEHSVQVLSWKKDRISFKERKKGWRAFQGLRLCFWDPKTYFHLSYPTPVEHWKLAARWWTGQLRLNGREMVYAHDKLVELYWECREFPIGGAGSVAADCLGRYSIFGFVEDKRLDRSFVAVVDGLCHQLPELPIFQEKEFSLPGLTLVIGSPEFALDVSGLRLVQDFESAGWADGARSMVKELRRKLLRVESARYYHLRNWHALGGPNLLERPLFAQKDGTTLSLSQLRRRVNTRAFCLDEVLEPIDAGYARELLPPTEPHRFSRGYDFPDQALLSPDGRWVAFLGGRRCHVLNLEQDRPVLWLEFESALPEDGGAWHPTQPWLALVQGLEVVVWDVERDTILFRWHVKGALGPAFSSDGSSLQVLESTSSGFKIFRWTVANWQRCYESGETLALPRVVGDSIVAFHLDRISVRTYDRPEYVLAEFSFPVVPLTICDVSLSKRWVALSDQRILFLLDLQKLTMVEIANWGDLRMLGGRRSRPLFSWREDYLFFCLPTGCAAYDLASGRVGERREGFCNFSRCGTAFRFPLVPRSVNFLKYETSSLISTTQTSPQGIVDRTVHLLWGDDAWTALSLEREQPRIVWDYSPCRYAVTDDYFAFRGPLGVTVFQHKTGALKFVQGGDFLGRAVRDCSSQLLEPRTLTQNDEAPVVQKSRTLSMTEAAPIYQVVATDDGKTAVVDLETGSVSLYDVERPVQANADYIHWETSEGARLDYSRAKRTSYEFHESVKSTCLHPRADWKLVSDGVTTTVNFVTRSGTGRWIGQVEGKDPRFSPSGAFVAVLYDDTIILCTERLEKLGSFPSGRMEPREWNWLTDRAIRIGENIWIRDRAHGWKKPHLLEARLPGFMQTCNRANLGLASCDGEVHFYCLTTGRKKGVFHPIDDGFFFYTSDGRWEGSPEWVLDFVEPSPAVEATPGLLISMFQEATD